MNWKFIMSLLSSNVGLGSHVRRYARIIAGIVFALLVSAILVAIAVAYGLYVLLLRPSMNHINTTEVQDLRQKIDIQQRQIEQLQLRLDEDMNEATQELRL